MTSRRRHGAVLLAGALVVLIGFGAVALLVAGPGAPEQSGGATTASEGAPTAAVPPGCRPGAPEPIEVEVVRTVPHDAGAYTQGLVMDGDRLFESTGRQGVSALRELDPDTGAVLARAPLPADQFGEGLALADGGRLVQLTWKDGVAYEWRTDGPEQLGRFSFEGEGWGLSTLDDGTLVMSDGSDRLTLRDPNDFSVLGRRTVQRAGGPADRLNELEWDGTALWANRYQTDELVRIDPDCGVVTGVADLSGLRVDATRTANERGIPIDVTNGIAWIPGTDRYLVTGKWWPTMYEVRLS